MASLLERKEKLKEDVAGKLEERDRWRAKFKCVCVVQSLRSSNLCAFVVLCSDLNGQWERKVKIIDSLEQTLQEVQKSFSERENQLLLEKDQAVQTSQ